jgi:serine/threonine protein kinase
MSGSQYCPRCLTTFVGGPTRCTNLACGAAQPQEGWDNLLDAGDVLDRHYRILRCLAIGGAGFTYLAREIGSDGELIGPDVAIKVLFAARNHGPFLRRLANEAQILRELDHPHIVQCLGFTSRIGHAPYLVTRFERGGSLQEHVEHHGALPPRVAAAVVHQILEGLVVAHKAGVVHRDLKPDNVLLEAEVARDQIPTIRLADFGIAKVQSSFGDKLTQVGGFVGTPEYAAPEQFVGAEPSSATDVFAAAGVLVFCLTGQVPVRFTHRGDIETSYNELLDRLPFELPAALGPERAALQQLIIRMVAIQADERPTAGEVLEALSPISGLEVSATARKAQPTVDIAPKRRTPTPARAARAEAPPPAPLPAPAPAPAPSGGRAVGFAVGGLGLVALGVAALLVVLVPVGLWAAGVFDGPPPASPTGPSALSGPIDLNDATDAASIAERTALEQEFERAGRDVARLCSLSEPVPLAVAVSGAGAVTDVTPSPGLRLDPPTLDCVVRGVSAARVPRSRPVEVRLRVRVAP